jgi:hypothetical protein
MDTYFHFVYHHITLHYIAILLHYIYIYIYITLHYITLLLHLHYVTLHLLHYILLRYAQWAFFLVC